MGKRKCTMEGMEMIMCGEDVSFWKGKKVFITGHTGFKGSWLSYWLFSMGARVTGYALPPPASHNLFSELKIDDLIEASHLNDVRDYGALKNAIEFSGPEVIIHMAAQPLVGFSYRDPIETYSTNVMGTVNLLQSLRFIDGIKATLVVTSDKCYENKEWEWGYREIDRLGGRDPYSNSKSCVELLVSSFRDSFFKSDENAYRNVITTARAGNVIGGGDWSTERLMPHILSSLESGSEIKLRQPHSIRPWQHVLESIYGYLTLARHQYQHGDQFEGAWNFGPNDSGCKSVEYLVDVARSTWNSPVIVSKKGEDLGHEAKLLKLDCSKSIDKLGWSPKWNIDMAIKQTISWHKSFLDGQDMRAFTLKQIKEYIGDDDL